MFWAEGSIQCQRKLQFKAFEYLHGMCTYGQAPMTRNVSNFIYARRCSQYSGFPIKLTNGKRTMNSLYQKNNHIKQSYFLYFKMKKLAFHTITSCHLPTLNKAINSFHGYPHQMISVKIMFCKDWYVFHQSSPVMGQMKTRPLGRVTLTFFIHRVCC